MSPILANAEQSMSADILQRLVEAGETTHDELRRLLAVGRSTVYEYLGHRDLRWAQLVVLFQHAKSDSVREALLSELLACTTYIAHRVNPKLDINGDGVVDIDDAVQALTDLMMTASASLQRIHRDRAHGEAVRLLDEVIDLAVGVRNIVAYLRDSRVRAHTPGLINMRGRS